MTTTQGIKLDEDTRKRLRALGEARSRTPHWLMRTAVRDYLEREEKIEREKQEDMERWRHYQLTGKAVSHEAAAKWLGELAESNAKSGKTKKCPK